MSESVDEAAHRAGRARPRELVVSIVNYRTGAMTLEAVRSVLADRGGIELAVVVVDNRSGDGSAEEIEAWIAAQDPPVPVHLVRSATNSGFAGGHNQGIAALEAEFYMILNSDALLVPGCLARLLAAARADPGAALVSPRIEHPDGRAQAVCFRGHTPLSEFLRAAQTGLVARLLGQDGLDLGQTPAPGEIAWVTFAGVLLRAEAHAAIGPMDEGYFLYYEDADYGRRARAAGWGIRFAPEARMIHLRGGSAPVKALMRAQRRLPAYFYAARSRYFCKAFGRGGLLAANLLWHLGRGVARARRLAGRAVPPAVEAEWRDIWINFRDPLGDRRAPGD